MDAKQLTTPSGKRTTAASVFKSHHHPHPHHVVRNADIVDVASDASLYCGSETEPDAEDDATATTTTPQQSPMQSQSQSQPQPTPRAAPRVASATTSATAAVNPPTPKPRQAVKSSKVLPNSTNPTLSRSRQRLIKVDFSKLQDDEHFFDESSISSAASTAAAAAHLAELHRYSQPKMPPYPIGGYMLGSQTRHDSPATLMRPRRTSI